MGKDYILVIDEGTTGTRAILFDKKFQIAEQSYEEFCQHTPAENMVEHDAEEIYDLSVKMCKNVIEKKGISAENIIGSTTRFTVRPGSAFSHCSFNT